MLLELTEDQRIIRETAREFAEKELAPRAAAIDRQGEIPKEIFSQLGELGFWGIMIPETYGGAGLIYLAMLLILEEISRACASTSVVLSVHNSLTCAALVRYGNEAQKKKYLPDLASGKTIGAYALTEPDAGSDAASLSMRAEKTDRGYLLNGTKIFITNASIAGIIVVFARTHPDKNLRAKGISAFLVDPKLKGVTIGKPESKMGIRGSKMSEIVLEDCLVPAENLLAEENQGFKIAMDLLNGGRIGIAIQAVGIARAAMEASIKYARERVQFNKPIADFGMIQWKLASMATEIEAARLFIYQAVLMRDKNIPHMKEASMAKLFASTMCNKVAKETVQIHGGLGYTKEAPVERYFRDAKVTEIYEGTTEVQNLVIARALLGKNNK